MRNIRLFVVLLAVLISSLLDGSRLVQPLLAQENHCDPDLQQPNSDPYGYRLRGDRCEGIYIREHANTILLVVSLTEWVEDFDTAANQDLHIEWTVPASSSVHLRAYSLKPRIHYRMDSTRPASSTSYVWPPSLLANLNLRKTDLGILAWISSSVAQEQREVYLPLRVTQRTPPPISRAYQLVLLPGVELAEVFISLAPVKPDGSPGAFIKKDQAVESAAYPAGRAFTIPITNVKAPGIYYLEIGATLRAGGSSTAQVWFYHHK